jgi:hypothetical protein
VEEAAEEEQNRRRASAAAEAVVVEHLMMAMEAEEEHLTKVAAVEEEHSTKVAVVVEERSTMAKEAAAEEGWQQQEEEVQVENLTVGEAEGRCSPALWEAMAEEQEQEQRSWSRLLGGEVEEAPVRGWESEEGHAGPRMREERRTCG